MADEISEPIGVRADDWQQLQNVLAEYCNSVDQSRFDDFEGLFTEDAVVTARLAGRTYRGPAEIRSYLETQPPNMRGVHVTVNPHIEIDGDEATAEAAFFVMVPRDSATVVGAWGWYRDRLSYESGRWFFRERRIETQWKIGDAGVAR